MAVDIGEIIFVQILQMSQYPGSPFTGELFRDLIMFLLVPTIFIIIVVYTTVGRVLASAHPKMRLLLGVGLYLFIIASGYYAAFALLAGPYFIFLIFIIGLFYFIIEHFTGGHPEASAGGGARGGGGGMARRVLGGTVNPLKRETLMEDYIAVLESIAASTGEHEPRAYRGLWIEKHRLEVDLFGRRLNNREVRDKTGIDLSRSKESH